MLSGFVWLTNIDTSEPVGFPLSKVLLIEQRRAQDGGAVSIVLENGKELMVSESLLRVTKAMSEAKAVAASPVATHPATRRSEDGRIVSI